MTIGNAKMDTMIASDPSKRLMRSLLTSAVIVASGALLIAIVLFSEVSNASSMRDVATMDICGPFSDRGSLFVEHRTQVIAMACGELRLTNTDSDSDDANGADDDSSDASDGDLQIAATKSVDA